MDYLQYKFLHLVGLSMVLVTLGGIALFAANGGKREGNRWRPLVMAMHGIGLLMMLVAGFGLMAKLGTEGFPGWVVGKLVIWLLFGAALAIPYRQPKLAGHLLWVLPLLTAIGVYLALFKPF